MINNNLNATKSSSNPKKKTKITSTKNKKTSKQTSKSWKAEKSTSHAWLKWNLDTNTSREFNKISKMHSQKKYQTPESTGIFSNNSSCKDLSKCFKKTLKSNASKKTSRLSKNSLLNVNGNSTRLLRSKLMLQSTRDSSSTTQTSAGFTWLQTTEELFVTTHWLLDWSTRFKSFYQISETFCSTKAQGQESTDWRIVWFNWLDLFNCIFWLIAELTFINWITIKEFVYVRKKSKLTLIQ